MGTKINYVKLWGMPGFIGVITITGLLLAIMGTGIWHILSWITLSIPLYSLFKHGAKFFK